MVCLRTTQRFLRTVRIAAFLAACLAPTADAQIDFEGDHAGNAAASIYEMAVGDIDGNGAPDIVTADQSTGGTTLRVLWNSGDADLFGPFPLDVGALTESAALGDLDQNGYLDIVASVPGGQRIAVLLNQVVGIFAPRVDYGTTVHPGGIAVSDVDLDGDLDIVVACSNVLSVFLGDGSGAFGPRTDLAITATGGRLFLADLDGDGDEDAIVSGRFQNLLSVCVNLGNGTFGTPQPYATGPQPRGIAAADLDGDGDLDVVVTNEVVPGILQVFPNVGGGALGTPVPITTIRQCVTVAAGDTDLDGDPDLLVGGWGSITLAVHENQGAFKLSMTEVCCTAGGNGVLLSDMDGDGDRDIVATGTNLLAVLVVRNDAGRFGGQTRLAVGSGPGSVLARDFDGDLDLDLVTLNRFDDTFSVLLDQGESFAPATSHPTGPSSQSLVAGDFDLDGDVDLAFVRHDPITPTGELRVLQNAGNATFSTGQSLGLTERPLLLEAGDVDGDGDLDLIVTRLQLAPTIVLRNTGGVFAADTQALTSGHPRLGDVDGDGDLDLVVGGSTPGFVVHANAGTGTFAPATPWSSILEAGPIELGDIDGDGDLDVVVGTGFFASSNVAVHLNPGNGTFASFTVHPTGGYGRTPLHLFDADGDGDLDLAAAHDATSTVAVFENLGGSFGLPRRFGLVLHAAGLASSDFDADGDIDLIASASGSSELIVLRNARTSGVPVCAGDGGGTACPCGNASAPGSGAGCLNSFGNAGTLRGEGRTSLADDELVLTGTHMPDAAALYFQGTNAIGGGAGVVFGDGLRCAGGTLVRLATRINAGGSSSYPASNEASHVAARHGRVTRTARLPSLVPQRRRVLHAGHVQPHERMARVMGTLIITRAGSPGSGSARWPSSERSRPAWTG